MHSTTGRMIRILFEIVLCGAPLICAPLDSDRPDNDRAAILQVREAVWRAWFSNDRATLERLVPPDSIAISPGESNWKTRPEIFSSAADFQAHGGKLIRLDFPREEIRRYKEVAIVYSQYRLELDTGGRRSVTFGRSTEVFVRRGGRWLNPGWHTDSRPQP